MSENLTSNLPSPEREDLALIAERAAGELEALRGKRLLVTGGAGFLGYYILRALDLYNARSGGPSIEVVVLDNFARGLPKWLEVLAESPHLRLLRHDVTMPLPDDLPEIDFAMHAASIASPAVYRRHPLATMDANVLGLRRLLDYGRERAFGDRPLEGLLFFSTSEIYGDPDPEEIPTSESYNGNVSCTGPRACYDESKRYGETLCVAFAAEHGLATRIVRPFNNYGPGLRIDDGRVLPDFAGAVLDGRDIVMYSDGSPTRTFCYIADAVVGYFKVLMRGRDGEPYNIGTDAPEISIAEMADRVATTARRLFGYEGRIVRENHEDRDYLVGNPSRRCPDIGKARAELGFEPAVALDEGLERTLTWYRRRADATTTGGGSA